MSDSYIEYGKRSTAFVGEDATRFFQAAVLASGLDLYAKCGMLPNRAWTPTAMLKAATKITGKPYKRGEHAKAAADVREWARTMKAALPVVDKTGEPS